MKKYRLLISHVGDDKDIALKCVERFKSDFENEQFALVPIYMENSLEPCVGDFGIWSENAVKSADGVLAIITDNTAVQKTVNGIVANIKIVYDEISLAKSEHKDLIILRQDGAALAEGYDLLLQRAKSVYFDKDNDLNEKLTEVVNEIISHAKHRFAGNPLLEYAGHETVNLIPSVKTDVSSYLGRSAELQIIDNFFNDGKRIVCLTGFGGIGKTTLAKMYAKHATEPVSIVYCSSEEMSLRDAVIGLRVEFDSPEFTQMTVEEKYNLRISQLKNLSNHVIVIFDNFNADFGLKNNVKVLEDLTALEKCKFIISSRCKLSRSDVGIIEVDKLNDDELLTLFYRDSHLPKTADNDSLINKLIETTKGHTMTMELAAKAVGIDENGIDLQEVVDGILSVDALTRVEDRADGYDEYQTIYAHLRTLFGLSQINEGQKLLLGCLSFVAKHGLSVKELKECVEYKTEDLLRLVGLGYISKTDTQPANYFLHPLMNDLAFIDFVRDEENLEKYDNTIDVILYKKSVFTLNDDMSNLNVLKEYGEHLNQRLTELITVNENANVYNELFWNCSILGDVLLQQGSMNEAERYYKQSHELVQDFDEEDGAEVDDSEDSYFLWLLSVSYSKLANLSIVQKGNIYEAEPYFKQCYKVVQSIVKNKSIDSKSFKYYLELLKCCSFLGTIADAKQDKEAADNYYKQGCELIQSILKFNAIQTLPSIGLLSPFFTMLGNMATSRDDIEKANELIQQGYELSNMGVQEIKNEKTIGNIAGLRNLCLSSIKSGDIEYQQGNIDEAEKYFKESCSIAQNLLDETKDIGIDIMTDRRYLYVIYSRLASVAQEKDNINEVELYYVKSLEVVQSIADDIKEYATSLLFYKDLTSCYINLGYVELLKENTSKAKNFLQKSDVALKRVIKEIGTIEETDIIMFIKALIRSYYQLGRSVEIEKEKEDALLSAFDLSKMLYDAKLDNDWDYRYTVKKLLRFYVNKGDTENAKKMQDILDSLSYK